jgi:uncharacterized protein (DUF1499 family)
MRGILLIIALLAFAAAAAISVAGPGTRFGWWNYETGLTIMRGLRLPAITLAGLSGLSFIIALFKTRNLSVLLLLATIAVGCAAIVPIKFEQLVGANPFIHDITTDFDHPPKIVAGAAFPRNNPPEYMEAQQAPHSDLTIAEAQKKAFPDIKPVVVDVGIKEAVRRARATLQDMKMDILKESSNGTSTIEATYTSFWFGFIDDFVVRLTTEGKTTRIDVRSKSRVGVSDLGANADRIREFYSKFQGV